MPSVERQHLELDINGGGWFTRSGSGEAHREGSLAAIASTAGTANDGAIHTSGRCDLAPAERVNIASLTGIKCP